MEDQNRWQRIRQHSPSWVLSLALHAAVLAALGMITWYVAAPPRREPVLGLADADLVEDEGQGADRGGDGGEAPGQRDSREAAVAAVLAKMPQPKSLTLQADDLLVGPARPELLAAAPDAGGSLIDILGEGGPGPTGLGPGRGLGGKIRELRGKGLDVVLVIDATGSMSPFIEQAKKRLQSVMRVVTHLVPGARFGVVAYKDYDADYGTDAVKVRKVTDDHEAVRGFIGQIVATFGADEPEPIQQALAVITDLKRMGWRRGRKWVVILVGDSTIHSSGRQAAFRHARTFSRQHRGTINVIDTGGATDQGRPRRTVQPDLARIAKEGGGSSFLLTQREAFWRHLIVSVFGRQYEQDVNTIIQTLVEKE